MIPETVGSFKGLPQRTCSESSLGIWLHEEATGKLTPPASSPDKEGRETGETAAMFEPSRSEEVGGNA